MADTVVTMTFKEALKVMRPKVRSDVPFEIQVYLVDHAEQMLEFLEWMGSKSYIPEYAYESFRRRVQSAVVLVDKYRLASHIGCHRRLSKRRCLKECIDPGDAAEATGLTCETCGRPMHKYASGTTCVNRCNEGEV